MLSDCFRAEPAFRLNSDNIQYTLQGPAEIHDGTLTPTGTGEVVLTARAGDSAPVALTIPVSERITSLTLPTRVRAAIGATVDLRAQATWAPEGVEPYITWSLSELTLATIDGDALTPITATGAGEATITAESWNGVRQTAKVTVHSPITALTLEAPADYMLLDELDITVRDQTGEIVTAPWVTLQSSDPTVATMLDSGRVYLANYSTATITASTHAGISGSLQLRVMEAIESFEIDAPATLEINDTATLSLINIRPVGANPFASWESSDTSILKVDAQGHIIALSTGTAQITSTSWDGVTRNVTISVILPPPGGITLQLNGTIDPYIAVGCLVTDLNGNPIAAETIQWTSSNTSVAEVDASGNITPLQPGEAVITAVAESGANNQLSITVPTLPTLVLPAGLKRVDAEAFMGDAKLMAVEIPANVETIESDAFKNCTALRVVIFRGSAVTIDPTAFTGCANLHFICPADSDAQAFAVLRDIPCHLE